MIYLMSFLRFYFPFFFSDPEIGDKYIHMDNASDPWADDRYCETVIDKQGGWCRMKSNSGAGCERSIRTHTLKSFYIKTNKKGT